MFENIIEDEKVQPKVKILFDGTRDTNVRKVQSKNYWYVHFVEFFSIIKTVAVISLF